MKQLAILLRSLQLAAHSYHNLVKGESFFADHEFLGELYPVYEGAYDSVIERIIGLEGMKPKDLLDVQMKAAELLKTIPESDDCEEIFKAIYDGEMELQDLCKKIKGSIGTMNLIAQFADDSEVRCYKLKQRMASEHES